MESNVKKDFFRKYCDCCNCSEDCAYKIRGLQCNDLDCIETGIEFAEENAHKCKDGNMERNITVTLKKEREWFNGENEDLKNIALQAFSKDKLLHNFKNITTFKMACEDLCVDYNAMISIAENMASVSKASAAMFKLSIVRKSLNLGRDLHFAKDPKNSSIYYPFNPCLSDGSTFYEEDLYSGEMEIIGKIKNDGIEYTVLGGHALGCDYAFGDPIVGLGYFYPGAGVGGANASVGYLGCANEDIAKHFGKYFGMLITESKYGDMIDFNIIEDKYGCTQ